MRRTVRRLKAGALGRAAAILAGVPVIVHTFHGHVLRGYFSPATSAVYRGIERRLAWRTDRLLAVTTHVRDELLALGVGKASQDRAVSEELLAEKRGRR